MGEPAGIGRRRPPLAREWRLAREKVVLEGCCRGCGRPDGEVRLEAAHVTGREHDVVAPLAWPAGEPWMTARRSVVVAPSRVVPLCGPATDSATCHGRAHERRLEWLEILRLDEQLQAVADLGSIHRAITVLSPAYRRWGTVLEPADGEGRIPI